MKNFRPSGWLVVIVMLAGVVVPDLYADGPPKAWAMPKPSRDIKVNKTIVVPKGKTMDFAYARLVPAKKMGDGSQNEFQRPVITLMKGASVKHVIIGKPGVDGIHCSGDNNLIGVWFEDVGEDAVTVMGANVRWIGGGARKAADKIVQLNHKGPFHGEDLFFDEFTTGVRGNGNKEFRNTPFMVTLKNIGARDGVCLLRFSSAGARGELMGIYSDKLDFLGRAEGGSKIVWLDRPKH